MTAVRSRAFATILTLVALMSLLCSAAVARLILSDPASMANAVSQSNASLLHTLSVVILAVVRSLVGYL